MGVLRQDIVVSSVKRMTGGGMETGAGREEGGGRRRRRRRREYGSPMDTQNQLVK